MTDEPTVPSRLSIDCDDATVVVSGELDAHSAPALRAMLETRPSTDETVLDMSGITFMDSSGLRVLIDAHQQADESRGPLVVQSPSQAVERILKIAGVIDHLDVRKPTPDSS